MKVTVVDYGIGNLRSVTKALAQVGAEVAVATDARALEGADRLVLPGVGAFADAMRALEGRGFVDAIRRELERERPFLGICVGMQVLLEASTEFGDHRGIGFIPGRVVRIPHEGVKVPHVGWNELAPGEWDGTVFAGLERPAFYFVHSFHADTPHRIAEVEYGSAMLTAAIQKGAALGVQFHPEKSGPLGLEILRRFLG